MADTDGGNANESGRENLDTLSGGNANGGSDNTDGGNSGKTGAIDPAAAVGKKRGRPSNAELAARKSGDKSGSGIASGTTGRETGSKKAPLDVASLSGQLEGLHKMLALLTKRPYLEISPDESKRLAMALQNIAKQYKVEVNPAVMAWLQLVGVSAAIYAPRIGMELMVQKALRASKGTESVFAAEVNKPAQGLNTASATGTPVPGFGPPGGMNFAGT